MAWKRVKTKWKKEKRETLEKNNKKQKTKNKKPVLPCAKVQVKMDARREGCGEMDRLTREIPCVGSCEKWQRKGGSEGEE